MSKNYYIIYSIKKEKYRDYENLILKCIVNDNFLSI